MGYKVVPKENVCRMATFMAIYSKGHLQYPATDFFFLMPSFVSLVDRIWKDVFPSPYPTKAISLKFSPPYRRLPSAYSLFTLPCNLLVLYVSGYRFGGKQATTKKKKISSNPQPSEECLLFRIVFFFFPLRACHFDSVREDCFHLLIKQ